MARPLQATVAHRRDFILIDARFRLSMQAVSQSHRPLKQTTVQPLGLEIRRRQQLRVSRTAGGCLLRPVAGSKGSQAMVFPAKAERDMRDVQSGHEMA